MTLAAARRGVGSRRVVLTAVFFGAPPLAVTTALVAGAAYAFVWGLGRPAIETLR